jgi:hypothetical protein
VFPLASSPRLNLAAHDELLSERHLVLQASEIGFTQAAISWRRTDRGVTWSGTVRDATNAVGLPSDGVEISLSATTLDGRTVEGRAIVGLNDDAEPLVAFTGVGPLFLEGRRLL